MNEDGLSNLSLQQLSESFNLLAADATEYAVILLGEDGRLLYWNPGAERLFLYQPNEIIGQHFSVLFAPEDILTGQPEHELKRSRSAGRARFAGKFAKMAHGFGAGPLSRPCDEHKQVRSFARVMHDLTDTQAQDAQKKRSDDLAAANRSKEEFMALLSHELRNPLSPILNALSIMRRMKTNDPIIEQAGEIIDRQVVQMVRLVDDLLDISRITQGKLRLTKEKVELRVVANSAAETARPLMDARKHDFSVSLPTEAVWVDADPARLEQIVVNLLNNAAKYTDPGGLIRMSVVPEGTEAVIRVRDNGVGIDPETLPRVFDLFTQADGAIGRSQGGLGIGLALVRTLVEMQEGRVQAQSGGLGQGSEFTVKLPVVPASPGQGAKTVLDPVVNLRRPLHILIAEDNVDSADSLSLLLRLYGHDVRVARTGPTALEMASASRPDVLLMDIGLPGMNGHEVIRRLRERPEFKTVKVCALTGFTPSEADRQRQQQAGFDHYYVKPVKLATLLDLFKTVEQQSPVPEAPAAANQP